MKCYFTIIIALCVQAAAAQWTASGSNLYYTNGMVGIGTSSPAARLHVTGLITADATGATTDFPNIRLYNGSAATSIPGEYRADLYLHTSSGQMTFRNVTGNGYNFINAAAGSSLLNILNNGYVGIGTATPARKLHILGSGSDLGGWIENTGTGGSETSRLSFKVAAGGADPRAGVLEWFDGTNFKGDLRFYRSGGIQVRNSNDVPVFDVLNSGNVGIGTTTPTEKLEVAGSASATHLTIKNNGDNVLESVESGEAHQLIGTYRGWDTKAVYIAGYNASNLSTFKTERVYIGNPSFGDKFLSVNLLNGHVGIGTNNVSDANYRLFVETGIRTRKVKVDQVGWADYVFEPTYRLPSLKEVETFIQKHRHLPDVPSAAAVEKNGLDLGENQAILLKKIEELTLYIIGQDKQLQEQQQAIQLLRERLEKLELSINN